MNFVCFLFGHKLSKDEFYDNNNVQHCDRCLEDRAFYHTGESYWTERECFGMVNYPIWVIKWWFKKQYWKVLDKIKKLKKDDFDDSDVPF